MFVESKQLVWFALWSCELPYELKIENHHPGQRAGSGVMLTNVFGRRFKVSTVIFEYQAVHVVRKRLITALV